MEPELNTTPLGINPPKIMSGFPRNIFVLPPSQHFDCPICHKVVRDPVHCTDEHHFCRGCLFTWMKTNTHCPCDRKPLELSSIIPSKFLNNIINDLVIHCPTTAESGTVSNSNDQPNELICPWTGPIKSVDEHMINCEYVKIECKLSGCIVQTMKKLISEHEKECLFRIVTCSWCSSKICYNILETHKEECLERPVSCLNNCGSIISFSSIETHRLECPSELVSCPLKEPLGCDTQCMRSDLNNHLDDMKAHYRPMIGAIMKLQDQCNELEKENTALKLGYSHFISLIKSKIDLSASLVDIHTNSALASPEKSQSNETGGCQQA